MSVDARLESAAQTFRDRNSAYGSAYLKSGAVMAALFPGGVKLLSPGDHVRFFMIRMIVSKLTRYAGTFADGGHKDSIHDAVVYAAMLEDYDDVELAQNHKRS